MWPVQKAIVFGNFYPTQKGIKYKPILFRKENQIK